MNRSYCRQVLDCGDGVGEVTALASDEARLRMPHSLAAPRSPSESGDSADSVAAVQDARAPTRAGLLGSWSQCTPKFAWRLSTTLVAADARRLILTRGREVRASLRRLLRGSRRTSTRFRARRTMNLFPSSELARERLGLRRRSLRSRRFRMGTEERPAGGVFGVLHQLKPKR